MSERRTIGGNGSHWDGCYKTHADCADALIEKQRERIAALEAAFRHMHKSKYIDGVLLDRCALCNFDLRDPVHLRLDAERAKVDA